MKFEKAVRKKARLRLALTGPSGSGKTHGALLIAKGIGGKVAVIDTEKGSASLYSHLAEFDVLELAPPYSPERFIEAVDAAEAAGYDVLILDSVTHEWTGVGGCLELVDEVARARYKGNSWSAWNDITPRHRAFLDALLRSRMHIIVTLRSKTETTQTEENGRKKVVKLGMKAEQRDGFEYEMTTVLDIVHDGHFAIASKDRTGLFLGDPKPISEETGRTLLAWLETGAEATAGILAELKQATKSGTDALVAAYNRLKTQTGFAALWKSEGAALKAAAARNDHDPDGNAGDTPSDEPANVDAAGTYQGEPA
jgi:hypothetical protein